MYRAGDAVGEHECVHESPGYDDEGGTGQGMGQTADQTMLGTSDVVCRWDHPETGNNNLHKYLQLLPNCHDNQTL